MSSYCIVSKRQYLRTEEELLQAVLETVSDESCSSSNDDSEGEDVNDTLNEKRRRNYIVRSSEGDTSETESVISNFKTAAIEGPALGRGRYRGRPVRHTRGN